MLTHTRRDLAARRSQKAFVFITIKGMSNKRRRRQCEDSQGGATDALGCPAALRTESSQNSLQAEAKALQRGAHQSASQLSLLLSNSWGEEIKGRGVVSLSERVNVLCWAWWWWWWWPPGITVVSLQIRTQENNLEQKHVEPANTRCKLENKTSTFQPPDWPTGHLEFIVL